MLADVLPELDCTSIVALLALHSSRAQCCFFRTMGSSPRNAQVQILSLVLNKLCDFRQVNVATLGFSFLI